VDDEAPKRAIKAKPVADQAEGLDAADEESDDDA